MNLLNCPFCGSEDVDKLVRVTYGHGDCGFEACIRCKTCGAHGPNVWNYGTDPNNNEINKIIEGWNKRNN